MKKARLFAVLALGALFFTSCVKEYTCTCTVDDGTNTYTETTTIEGTKAEATAECESQSLTIFGITYECDLN